MANTLYDSTYLDTNGNQIVWDDDVRSVVFYDTSDEVWDRTGGGTSSWFLESSLPDGGFHTEIDSEVWAIDSSVDQYTISLDEKATFSINDSSGSLYLSSKGLWYLRGDFDVLLGIENADYFDEYRSATSFGLNISIGDVYNVRAAIVRNVNSTASKAQVFYTYNANPKYFGWTKLCDESSTKPSYFRIVRTGGTISVYFGTVLMGSVSGAVWTDDAYIKIGAECPEINKYTMSALYFNVLSGELSESNTFSSIYRGPNESFPEKALLLIDDVGLSIVDADSLTLWCRFVLGANNAFIDENSKISAINGKIYCATSSGLFVFDFVADKIRKYVGSSIYESVSGISSRNSYVIYQLTSSVSELMSDSLQMFTPKMCLGMSLSPLLQQVG
jgi:hypothetical protein